MFAASDLYERRAGATAVKIHNTVTASVQERVNAHGLMVKVRCSAHLRGPCAAGNVALPVEVADQYNTMHFFVMRITKTIS